MEVHTLEEKAQILSAIVKLGISLRNIATFGHLTNMMLQPNRTWRLHLRLNDPLVLSLKEEAPEILNQLRPYLHRDKMLCRGCGAYSVGRCICKHPNFPWFTD